MQGRRQGKPNAQMPNITFITSENVQLSGFSNKQKKGTIALKTDN